MNIPLIKFFWFRKGKKNKEKKTVVVQENVNHVPLFLNALYNYHLRKKLKQQSILA